MHRVVAGVLVLAFASGADLAAQAPDPSRRILIVADELSLQFRSTPRVRDLISHTLGVLRRNGDVVRMVSTGGSRTAVPLSADPTVSKTVGKGLAPGAVASATATSEDAVELRLRSDLSSSAVAAALRSISATGSGPITVLYFTEGYPAFVPEPTEFIQEALRVNATIYAIDPRGFSEPDKQFDAKDWKGYVAATHGSVRTLASRTKGAAVFTPSEFDAVLSSLSQRSDLH